MRATILGASEETRGIARSQGLSIDNKTLGLPKKLDRGGSQTGDNRTINGMVVIAEDQGALLVIAIRRRWAVLFDYKGAISGYCLEPVMGVINAFFARRR
jgi:galactose mutarotase-like enzyme